MTGYLWAALGLLAGLAMTVLSDMASEEIRDRLDHLPHAILRLAARRLNPRQRATIYQDEWLPELTYILKGAETRPITRLITGASYAFGILASARSISRRVDRPAVERTIIFVDRAEYEEPSEYGEYGERDFDLVRAAQGNWTEAAYAILADRNKVAHDHNQANYNRIIGANTQSRRRRWKHR